MWSSCQSGVAESVMRGSRGYLDFAGQQQFGDSTSLLIDSVAELRETIHLSVEGLEKRCYSFLFRLGGQWDAEVAELFPSHAPAPVHGGICVGRKEVPAFVSFEDQVQELGYDVTRHLEHRVDRTYDRCVILSKETDRSLFDMVARVGKLKTSHDLVVRTIPAEDLLPEIDQRVHETLVLGTGHNWETRGLGPGSVGHFARDLAHLRIPP